MKKMFILLQDIYIYPVNLVVNARKCKLVNFSLLQAKCAIALKWKETNRPIPNQCIKEITSSLASEKLTYVVKGKPKEFYKI